MKRRFYVDACIYLNLWQKEKNFWYYAKTFFDTYQKDIIYYSGFLLKEIKYILSDEEFHKKCKLFHISPNFRKITLSKSEFIEAQKIESETDFEISFFDIIHMLLAKKTDSILVTRDNRLLSISPKYGVTAKRPEEL